MNPNPSLLNQGSIEFFTVANELHAVQGGRVYEQNDLTLEMYAMLGYELDHLPNAQLGLDKLGVTDTKERIIKFANCRFGSWNLTADFEGGKCTDIEVTMCEKRSTCPAAGLLCKNAIDAAYGKISVQEMETARLVAKGKTDQEIADARYLSVHAIHMHVKMILEKTGMKNRVEITNWVRGLGI